MAVITCEKKKLEDILKYLSINGLLQYVGMRIDANGTVTSIQFDTNSTSGSQVAVVGEFRGLEIDEDVVFGIDAKKMLDFLKVLKENSLIMSINDTHIELESGKKKIKTDRIDVSTIDTYQTETPFKMDGFLPLFRKGTVETTTHCTVEGKALKEMVKDTKAFDQTWHTMIFSKNGFTYVAGAGPDKRGKDSIEADVDDVSVTGEDAVVNIGSALLNLVDVFGDSIIGIDIAQDKESGVYPVWFTVKTDWCDVGFLVPPTAE